MVGDGVDAGARDDRAAIDKYPALFARDVAGRQVHQAAIDIEPDAGVRTGPPYRQGRIYIGNRACIGEGNRGDAVDGNRVLPPGRYGGAIIEYVGCIPRQRLRSVARLYDGLAAGGAGDTDGKRGGEGDRRSR